MVARPWKGKELVQHVSRFKKKKKSMYTPSLSNTTQVLGRLLCQGGFEKEKAEFSDITCSRHLPGPTASGYYDSEQKVVKHNLGYT